MQIVGHFGQTILQWLKRWRIVFVIGRIRTLPPKWRDPSHTGHYPDAFTHTIHKALNTHMHNRFQRLTKSVYERDTSEGTVGLELIVKRTSGAAGGRASMNTFEDRCFDTAVVGTVVPGAGLCVS